MGTALRSLKAVTTILEVPPLPRTRTFLPSTGIPLCFTRETLKVTPYEELRAFIQQELGDLFEEVQPE